MQVPADDIPLSLAADFPPAGDAQWRKLVDKVLAGADFDKKLVSRTYDGIAIQPLYTRADWQGSDPPAANRAAGWDIRQVHALGDPAATNAAILEDLEGGVNSIVLTAADARADDLDRALAGVYLDFAPVVLDIAGPTLPAALALEHVLDARNVGAAFAGNFGLDDLGSFAGTGNPAAVNLEKLAEAAITLMKACPAARAFNVRGQIYHATGASQAQELGCAVATGLAYLRALTAAGLDVAAAAGQIAFTLAADADVFLTVAKFRAARKLWARIGEVCGVPVEKRTALLTGCTAARMMTQRDPWVNVLRTTVAAFAAGVGGADAVSVLPLDAAIGPAGARARRVARNSQIVLLEESSLGKVADPAAGAWLFERLTDDLAGKAWAFFQEIERRGGMAEALSSGFVNERITAVRTERDRNIARRKDPITGVSEFPNLAEADVDSVPARATTGALPAHRLAEGFERLRDASDAFKKIAGDRPRIFLANLGTVADFTARATYARNFFEAGGIAAMAGSGGTDPGGIARDFADSGANFAVICSTDAVYNDHAAAVARALKDRGAAILYVAGRAGETEARLRAAGVDEFIFMGCDLLATLDRAYARLRIA